MSNVIPVGGPNGSPIILPDQFTSLRSHQEQAILEIIARFDLGYKAVILDAPTGAGKTVIGEAVRQLRAGPTNRGLYLCTTLTLQDQFLNDFPYAALIKGRSNYATLDDPMRFLQSGLRHLNASHCEKRKVETHQIPACATCDEHLPDLTMEEYVPRGPVLYHCDNCHPWQRCPYEEAKHNALGGPLTVANTSYFMAESNYVGTFGEKHHNINGVRKRYTQFPMTVIDEADTLESVMMNYVDLEITQRMVRKMGLRFPDRVTKVESWLEWCVYAAQHLNLQVDKVTRDLRSDPKNVRIKDELTQVTRYQAKVADVRRRIEAHPDNWVYDGGDGRIKLRAIRVGPYGEHTLWRHSDEFLLMSATTISPAQLAEDVGLENFASVRVDSQFPPERRKIHVMPRASMTNKTKEAEWPKMVDAVCEVLAMHPSERVLVHTVSYALTKYLQIELAKRLSRPIKYYLSSAERESALTDFRTSHAAVMLAPSFDRGVDLPDDDVRVIIIAKVPFPNIGDKQVNARFFGTGLSGKSWYATQTVRSLVQMTGRGMRHKDDFCTSYILDAQFNSNVWRNNRHLIPRWWTDAIHWTPLTR